MPAPNVIPFPFQHRSDPRYAHVHRAARRESGRVVKRRQAELLLPEVTTLDQRINAAKATAANYEAMAAAADRPVSRVLYERLAQTWNERVLALITERNALAVQEDFPLATGTNGGTR